MRWILAALLLTSSPVLAQSGPPLAVDLAAIAVAGFAEGVSARLLFPGIVSHTGAGQFALTNPDGRTTVMTVVETEKCVFMFTFATPGEAGIGMHLDANKISSIVFTPGGEYEGVPRYSALFSGAPGRVIFDLPSGSTPAPDGASIVVTSMPLTDIHAGIAALRTTYCPGLAA